MQLQGIVCSKKKGLCMKRLIIGEPICSEFIRSEFTLAGSLIPCPAWKGYNLIMSGVCSFCAQASNSPLHAALSNSRAMVTWSITNGSDPLGGVLVPWQVCF